MTTPPLADRGQPDVVHAPPYERSLGADVGTVLDELDVAHLPWHETVLLHAMAVRDDDRWVSRDVALVCPWLDDKRRVVAMREVIGAALLSERVLHTCPDLVIVEAVDGLLELVDKSPALQCLVQKVSRANGDQGVLFQGGGAIRFSGIGPAGRNGHARRDRVRGMSADLLVLDYASTITERDEEVIYPVTITRPNPQAWWVDTEAGGPFTWLRGRAHIGMAPEVLYLEWSGRE